MGIFNRKREVGSNFDEKKADEIFDLMDKTSDKKFSKNIKKEIDLSKEISNLLKEAKSGDDDTAIELYKKVIAIAPDNDKAYVELSRIYQKNNNPEDEIKILKLGIRNLTGNKKEELMNRLNEINH